MAIQLLTSRTCIGIIGNRAICAGFTRLGQQPYPTLGPGLQFVKGFSILYSNTESMLDKLMVFGSVPTTTGAFPSYAYGPVVWDLESLALHNEIRMDEIEGDLTVPAPYFPPDVMDNPPPVYGRATYLVGASLGMMALSQIGQIYPAGWNKNVALDVVHGVAYWFDPWSTELANVWLVATQDCVPTILPKFVFPVNMGEGIHKLVILDSNKIYVYGASGLLNGYGRLIWTREAVYDCPGYCFVATRLGDRFVCGITQDKVCWIFDVHQQVFWQISSIPWPDVGVYDNFYTSNTRICYDERRGHLIAHQPLSLVPRSDPPVYVGNKLIMWALVPVPSQITDPVATDTLRTKKRTFWYSKVLGDHGELISSKRVIGKLDDPIRGRLLSSQGASNARGQANFGYGGSDQSSDVGSSSITVTTDDGPGLP